MKVKISISISCARTPSEWMSMSLIILLTRTSHKQSRARKWGSKLWRSLWIRRIVGGLLRVLNTKYLTRLKIRPQRHWTLDICLMLTNLPSGTLILILRTHFIPLAMILCLRSTSTELKISCGCLETNKFKHRETLWSNLMVSKYHA